MPRQPNRIQGLPLGIQNPSVQTPKYANRAVPPPALLQRGPSQALEQFNHPEIHPAVARALNQLQQNINSAVSRSKNHPFGDGNLLEKVVVSNGNNVFHHGLSGPFRGYHVLGATGYLFHALVPQDPPALDQTTITINFSVGGPTVVDIWVFQ